MATLGGIYTFVCQNGGCGKVFQQYVSGDAAATECPTCETIAHRQEFSEKHAALDYDKPILSSSLGISPAQIPEAMKKFPHHEYAPDGRMIIRNHYERKKIMKELGFMDKDGF